MWIVSFIAGQVLERHWFVDAAGAGR